MEHAETSKTEDAEFRDVTVLGLALIMKARHLTEAQLSAQTGLTQAYINRLKHGSVDPRITTAQRICTVLGVPIEDAFLKHYVVRMPVRK